MTKKWGKQWDGVVPVHQISVQNLILVPFPDKNVILSQHQADSFKITFQTPTPTAPLAFFVLHPRPSCPYFVMITCFQRLSFSQAYLHIHLLSKALFNRASFLRPSPPLFLSVQTTSHLTRWVFPSKFPLPPALGSPFALSLTF